MNGIDKIWSKTLEFGLICGSVAFLLEKSVKNIDRELINFLFYIYSGRHRFWLPPHFGWNPLHAFLSVTRRYRHCLGKFKTKCKLCNGQL